MTLTNLEKYSNDLKSEELMLKVIKKKVDNQKAIVMDAVEVTHYLKVAESTWDNIKKLHVNLVNVDKSNIDDHNDVYQDLFELLTEVKCGLQRILATITPAHSTSASSSTANSGAKIKLPEIKLPTFSGEVQDWLTFRDMYLTAIHNNVSLSESQKFTYLQSSLTGTAAKLIKSFSITDQNYATAWDIITNRYENKRELFFSIIRKFLNHPSVSNDNPNSLRSIIDATNECKRALESLNLTDTWDSVLLYLISQKLDPSSKQFWELTLTDKEVPESDTLLQFIEQRARSLAAMGSKSTRPNHHDNQRQHSFLSGSKPSSPSGGGFNCKICKSQHLHIKCPKLLALSATDRRSLVREKRLCFKCLRDGHMKFNCTSVKSCFKCQQDHHSILHLDEPPRSSSSTNNPQSFHVNNCDQKQVLLATAVIKVKAVNGDALQFKALLDAGSTSSFVSESAMSQLGLPRSESSVEIIGISSASAGRTNGMVTIDFKPHFNDQYGNKFQVEAYVLNRITHQLPISQCDRSSWSFLDSIQLADPDFGTPTKIDLLLGADVFYSLLLPGKRSGIPGSPTAVNSKLGWLVAGPTRTPVQTIQVNHALGLDDLLTRFWEVEEIPKIPILTEEERNCEAHYKSTHRRNKDGRYVVEIPLKVPEVKIGSSREMAFRRFYSLERKLEAQPPLKQLYHDFMNQYLVLNHMEKLKSSSSSRNYLPHHYVMKDWNHQHKFRVVFDASAKTTNGKSFNEAQMVGPTIQDSIYNILMRFRINPIAFCADITKMYRQILVKPEQQELQCILWRGSATEPVQEFKLKTITYGTASGPYLATRTIKQLAEDEKSKYPSASKILQQDIYVDDVMSGGDSEEEVKSVIRELRGITESAKLPLRKFASNCISVLSDVPDCDREVSDTLSVDKDSVVKTLGLFWNTSSDSFKFKVDVPSGNHIITKRLLLSEISKVFDPIGWLSPIIITSKQLMQQVWLAGGKWDDPVSKEISDKWIQFKTTLPMIESINIPRCIRRSPSNELQLHGFSDASVKAYAAVVYVRNLCPDGSITVSQLAAKSKVAPVKKLQSLPRLELTGAHLLSNLIESIQESLGLNFSRVGAWTDSTIVLAWIKSNPTRWKTFVANRVSQIHEVVSQDNWGHVSGSTNPADCASRGIQPDEIIDHQLWWSGPKWLMDQDAVPPPSNQTPDQEEVLREEKRIVIVTKAVVLDSSILLKYSTLIKLQRVTAWIQRFKSNCQHHISKRKYQIGPHPIHVSGPLTAKELDESLFTWIRIVQKCEFSKEKLDNMTHKKSAIKRNLLSLCPFWDQQQILRVGGRINKSLESYGKKHPILLPRHHLLTELIIRDAHNHLLHAGPQLVQSILSNKYWIIRGRDAIRHQIRKCITCTRHQAETLSQQMGQLPSSRIQPSRPFSKVGVDFAGPIILRANPPRSKTRYKSYLSIFVCFVTRAIHVEVVSSLSTEAFLAALRRFVARRGRPTEIFSDNGTNFVGAAKEIKEMFLLLQSPQHNETIYNEMSKHGIEWNFNPPSAPHFGGLWEAGVKSVKYHLKRVIGDTPLTFEEMTTVTHQIESCLNSRPLTPFSSDPTDLNVLTPAHFLIGSNMMAIPDPDVTSLPMNRLSRWQLTQRLVQNFWKRWSQEYLSRLQQRPKWVGTKTEVIVGDLVLIKSDGLSPTNWPRARVLEIHPGPDGLTRVVTLKTSSGQIKRPITKLCLLPMDSSSPNSEQINHL